MKIKPIGSILLIKPIEAPKGDVLLGGIHVPANLQTKGEVKRVEVVAIGTKDIPSEIQVGSIILAAYLGTAVTVDGQKLNLLSIDDVIAVETE